MPIGGTIFTLEPGTPTDPQFIEFLYRGHSVESDGSTQQIINQLHFVKTFSLGVPTNLISVYNLVTGVLDAPLSAALSVTYVADNVTLRAMDSPLNLAVPMLNQVVGAVTGDRLPSFNSVVTRKYTNARGRSFRGSNHWAPIAESQTLLDNLTAGGQTLWDAVATALATFVGLVDGDGNAWSLFVLSRLKSDLLANPSLFTGATILNSTANALLGTMKRRKSGVGV